MEEWRKVPGYENYEISINTEEGKCRNNNYKRTGKTKELSNVKNNRGRINWRLYKNGAFIIQQAARWIALTYPELVQNEYFDGAEIDHIDTNPMNNHPSNLRWVTHSGNCSNPLTKKHMSEAKTGEKCYWYGKKRPEETKNKIRASCIRKGGPFRVPISRSVLNS